MRKLLVFCLSAVVLLLGAVSTVHADVPELMNYQGTLLDSGGDPVVGPVSVVFTIYDDPTGGDSKWTETRDVNPDANGAFSILLGEVQPLTDTVFSDPERYLGIAVAGDPEMTPRVRLASVGYSNRVATVDGASGGVIKGPWIVVSEGEDVDSCIITCDPNEGVVKLVVTDNMAIDSCTLTLNADLDNWAGVKGITIGNSGTPDTLWFILSTDLDDGAELGLGFVDDGINTSQVVIGAYPDSVLSFASYGHMEKTSFTYRKMYPDRAELGLGYVDDGTSSGQVVVRADSSGASLALKVEDDLGNEKDALLYHALTSGERFDKVELKLYRIDNAGIEEHYCALENRVDSAGGSITLASSPTDTTVQIIGDDGTAFFAGAIRSGNTLILDGPLDRLLTTSGEMYLGRDPLTGSFDDVAVGIGTQSPLATLHVNGTTRFSGVATMEATSSLRSAVDGGARILGAQGHTPAMPAIGFFGAGGAEEGLGIYRFAASNMGFSTQSTERMRITDWGSVVINWDSGLPDPASVLHVNGSVATAVATATANVTLGRLHSVILGDNSGGAITITLPPAICTGRKLTIKKISANVDGAVVVAAAGVDLIDGVSVYALNSIFDYVVLVCDGGGNWYIVSN